MEFRGSSPQHNPAPHPAPAAPAPAAAKKKRVSKPQGKGMMWIIIILVILALAAVAGYFYHKEQNSKLQIQKLSTQLKNPNQAAQAEQKQLIVDVSKITVLPTGETPTVATVSDISKLKGQVFFANAQNGDKVLIYTQAKKAYLYRPSTNKIINIAPVNLGDNSTSSTTNTTTNSTTKKTP